MARTVLLRHGAREYEVVVHENGRVRVGDREIPALSSVHGTVRVGSPTATAWTASSGDSRWVFLDGRAYEFELQREGMRRRRAASHHGTLMAPMPATVLRINVSVGDRVERGATLIILEAMKMELPVKSGSAARVESINCREGELVQPGAPLIEIEEIENS